MTLQKAIEIATIMKKVQVYLLDPDGNDTVQLLIEAGKRLKEMRQRPYMSWMTLLPGETEE